MVRAGINPLLMAWKPLRGWENLVRAGINPLLTTWKPLRGWENLVRAGINPLLMAWKSEGLAGLEAGLQPAPSARTGHRSTRTMLHVHEAVPAGLVGKNPPFKENP